MWKERERNLIVEEISSDVRTVNKKNNNNNNEEKKEKKKSTTKICIKWDGKQMMIGNLRWERIRIHKKNNKINEECREKKKALSTF